LKYSPKVSFISIAFVSVTAAFLARSCSAWSMAPVETMACRTTFLRETARSRFTVGA
jgi:hypothetical protein